MLTKVEFGKTAPELMTTLISYHKLGQTLRRKGQTPEKEGTTPLTFSDVKKHRILKRSYIFKKKKNQFCMIQMPSQAKPSQAKPHRTKPSHSEPRYTRPHFLIISVVTSYDTLGGPVVKLSRTSFFKHFLAFSTFFELPFQKKEKQEQKKTIKKGKTKEKRKMKRSKSQKKRKDRNSKKFPKVFQKKKTTQNSFKNRKSVVRENFRHRATQIIITCDNL